MAEEKKTEPPKQPPTPAERQQACMTDISNVLRKHRCQLSPVLLVEPVGNSGSKAQVEARFDVVVLDDAED